MNDVKQLRDAVASILTRLERIEKRLKVNAPSGAFRHIDPKAVRASLKEKGWTQSDLAAAMFGGRRINAEGKLDAIKKDRISVWLAGKQSPSPENWAKLRQFVDVV